MTGAANWSRGFTRRNVLRMAGATAGAIAVMEATGTPAYAEAKFTIGTAGGTWRDGIRAAFIDGPKFDETHKIAASYFDGPAAVVAARLLAQPNDPPYSAGDYLDGESALLADAGVLQDYDLSIVKNYADIFPGARSAPRNGLTHWHASMTLPTISVTWNTKHAAKPTSWQDLWNPRYKGKVGIPQFAWYGLTWLHAINKSLGGTEDDLSKGIAAISDLVKKNSAIVMQNQEQCVQAFASEEIIIMPYWNGRTFSLQAAGVPVEIAYVPGMIQLHNGFSIPKATRFTEIANRFINNTLDPELQVGFARKFQYPPANSKAKLPPDLEHYKIPESALEKVINFDWKKINDTRAAALEQWNREIYS